MTATDLILGLGSAAPTAIPSGAVGTVLSGNGVGIAPTFQAGGGGGVPSIAGTANQITQTGSPAATTLSLPTAGTLPGAWHSSGAFTVDSGDLTATSGHLRSAGVGGGVVLGAVDGTQGWWQISGGATYFDYLGIMTVRSITGGFVTSYSLDTAGKVTYDADVRFVGNVGFYNHAPVAQPATPVTLADVIAVLKGCGLTA